MPDLKPVPIGKGRDREGMLEAVDHLREAIENGDIVAFAAVGIEPGDATRMWKGATPGVTKLRLLGAMSNMTHWYTQLDDA